jgi:fatty-acyl-CoA synthase
MRGLMMDYQLTLPAMLRRTDTHFGQKRIVSRLPDRTIVRHSYADVLGRARRLGQALRDLGVRPGDRVATLAWNHYQHLEVYYAVPMIGAVLHTLNLRLHPDDLVHIVNDAADQVLLVDAGLLPLAAQMASRVDFRHQIVMMNCAGKLEGVLDYEELLASVDGAGFEAEQVDEHDAAAMCYTSGTTGRPKGVLYSHRALALHSLAQGLADCLGVGECDTVLPVVPMFHVNGWGLPFTTALFGANLVLPGSCLDPSSVLDLLTSERVTFAAGVPTVWLGVLQALDNNPGTYDLSALRTILIGGAAAPPALIRGFQERHGVRILHAWGMTEMSPVGTICNLPSFLRDKTIEDQYRYRARQGTPAPLVEIRARSELGLVPWDGQTMGELEVRGPWVAQQYYNDSCSDDRFTDDGWFKTGDIVTIDERGCIEIADRAKDLIKSGGEWISTVALENALMGHPSVAEAAVVGVPHEKWDERPLAVVVLRAGCAANVEELMRHLEPQFAKWWLPDAIEFIDQIPRTSAGKFRKSALREHYRDRYDVRLKPDTR